MNEKVSKLKKRTKQDMILSFVVAGLALIQTISLISDFVVENDALSLKGSMYGLLIMAATIVMGIMLLEVHRKGTPFTKKVTTLLRVLAIFIIIGGVMPEVLTPILVWMRNGGNGLIDFPVDIFVILSGANVAICVLGIAIGIISEIFAYGHELQEDNNSIA